MTVTKSIILGVVVLAGVIGVAVWANKNQPNSTGEPYASVSGLASPVVMASISASPSPTTSIPVTNQKNNMHEVTIKTNLGEIAFQTYDADAPKTVANFISLANKKFYDGVIFHRVITGFMIQGGDPQGTGTGGPGYQFEDELNPNTPSAKLGYVKGTVAMANAGPNTNGSQFFIMHQNYQLPHNYTIFGHVVRGQDIVDKIAAVQVGPNDRPVTPVTMQSVTVKTLP